MTALDSVMYLHCTLMSLVVLPPKVELSIVGSDESTSFNQVVKSL